MTDMERPPKWDSWLPESERLPDEEWIMVVDTDWTTPAHGQRCRFGSNRYGFCGKPPIATMFRGRTRRSWSYCPEHMYGRWVEDGKVWSWRAAPILTRTTFA
jgi:hypothetical protein